MNLSEAQGYVGRQVRGRLIGRVESSGGCSDKRLYLVDAEGERVMNVTNLTKAQVAEQSRLTTSGHKAARRRKA